MSKRILTGFLALALVACASAAAFASSTHKATVTFNLAQVSPSGASPVVQAGTVTGTYGAGAAVLRATVTGTTASSKGTVWYVRGTINATAKIQGAVQPDGSLKYTGTGKVTGGTGKFKGAKGNFTVTGTSPPNDTAHSTVTLKGTLKY